MSDGILFILVGPSGAGKNTLMKYVQTQLGDLKQLATFTTRSPRDNEQEGREHYFVTKDEFQRQIDIGALIEYTPVHMNNWYGTPCRDVQEAIRAGRDLIADIEPLGATQVHAAYPHNTVLIFVIPSRLELLEERILQRGGVTPEELANRLERARFEMTFAPKCHYLILNDLVEPAAEHLRQVIVSERQRRRGNRDLPALLPPTFHSTTIGLVRQGDALLVHVNSAGDDLPTFPITHPAHWPHEALQQALQARMGCAVTIDKSADKRFDFPPPHYVSIAAIPQDVYLYFYYQCALAAPEAALVGDWAWRPLADLSLPTAIKKLVK
jgi:guanylate kinase